MIPLWIGYTTLFRSSHSSLSKVCGLHACGPDDVWDRKWALARMNSRVHPPSPDAWKGKVDASGVKVYIIDTGVDFQDGSPFEYEFTGVINKGSNCYWACKGCGSPFDDERPIGNKNNLLNPNFLRMGACIWQCILSCTRAGHVLCLTLVCCPPSHRTHVASNACGNEHGLAENCELCSVKSG